MQFSLIRWLLVRLLALLVFLGLLPGLHAAGAEKKLMVAIFLPPDNPLFKVEADTVVSKANSLGSETLLLLHHDDPVKEAQLYDTAISRNPLATLLAQADTGSLKKATANRPKVNVDQNGVILKGYDAVAYFKQKRAVKGDPKYSTSYGGATYYFASADDKAEFDKTPAQYAPQYGGYCAHSMTKRKLADIDPNVFLVYKGKLYVCSSPKAGKAFYSDPDANIKKADTNWQFYQPPSNPGFRRELGS
jgi:YHS domain-containing protein